VSSPSSSSPGSSPGSLPDRPSSRPSGSSGAGNTRPDDAVLDVLVVGAGPTGLTLACELARRGIRPRIIDERFEPSQQSRAFGVHARTMELFDAMGAIQPLLARGNPAQGLSLYSRGQRIANIPMYGQIPSKYPFILIVAQSETERVLTEHLTGLGVAIERSTALLGFEQDEHGVTAELRLPDGTGQTVRCRYLVGCDGAHSAVRKRLGIEFEGAPYPNQWLLADLDLDWDYPQRELAVFTHPRGVIAYFPLAGQRGRVIFQLPETGLDDDLGEPTLDDVRRLLTERELPFRDLRDAIWMSYFRLHHRLAARFRDRRVFLAGDAGHIHSPVGGQGMNIGIQDAYNLAWKLALVLHGHAGERLLASYEVERRRVDEGVVDFTHRATTMVMLRSPILQALLNAVVRVATRLDAVQERMLALVSQIEHHYRASPIVAESWTMSRRVAGFTPPTDDLAPGERVPDFPLTHTLTGAETSLYALLSGTEHHLLLFTGVNPDVDELARLRDVVARVAGPYRDLIEIHLVRGPGEEPSGLPEVMSHHIDRNLHMHDAFGAGRASLYLIRPDGYVGFRNQPVSVDALSEYLTALFGQD
jgi:2-polyprenyl-6-methoxyphenol hydroxylase-like FAD-dependent oxidoreductase